MVINLISVLNDSLIPMSRQKDREWCLDAENFTEVRSYFTRFLKAITATVRLNCARRNIIAFFIFPVIASKKSIIATVIILRKMSNYSHKASQDVKPGVNAKRLFKKRFMTVMSLRSFQETIKWTSLYLTTIKKCCWKQPAVKNNEFWTESATREKLYCFLKPCFKSVWRVKFSQCNQAARCIKIVRFSFADFFVFVLRKCSPCAQNSKFC